MDFILSKAPWMLSRTGSTSESVLGVRCMSRGKVALRVGYETVG